MVLHAIERMLVRKPERHDSEQGEAKKNVGVPRQQPVGRSNHADRRREPEAPLDARKLGPREPAITLLDHALRLKVQYSPLLSRMPVRGSAVKRDSRRQGSRDGLLESQLVQTGLVTPRRDGAEMRRRLKSGPLVKTTIGVALGLLVTHEPKFRH